VVDNVRHVLAIELLCAAQGIDLRAPHRPGAALADAHATLRAAVPHLADDRPVGDDVGRVRALLDEGAITAAVRRHVELE